jgi:hypothetical protein
MSGWANGTRSKLRSKTLQRKLGCNMLAVANVSNEDGPRYINAYLSCAAVALQPTSERYPQMVNTPLWKLANDYFTFSAIAAVNQAKPKEVPVRKT